MRIGVLALQGNVSEHVNATKKAASALGLECNVIEVRTKRDLKGVIGLIIPGGESTTLQKLCEREGLFEEIEKVPNIFGTCAGAIMLAKKIHKKESDQRTLELMDIEVDRNGYGRQVQSFEKNVETKFGKVRAFFIRAPRIKSIGKGVSIIANNNGETIACQQIINDKTNDKKFHFYLATCFHPELSTTKFHEEFLRVCSGAHLYC